MPPNPIPIIKAPIDPLYEPFRIPLGTLTLIKAAAFFLNFEVRNCAKTGS